MTKKLTIAFALLLSIIGCNDDSAEECLMGTIIGYERCTNAVLIQVDAKYKIGRSITYNKTTYDNVVKAPALEEQVGGSTLYFQFRPYQKDQDEGLFEYTHCLAIYAPFDVPTIVITSFSGLPCDSMNE